MHTLCTGFSAVSHTGRLNVFADKWFVERDLQGRIEVGKNGLDFNLP
jgi:hypothetical protein